MKKSMILSALSVAAALTGLGIYHSAHAQSRATPSGENGGANNYRHRSAEDRLEYSVGAQQSVDEVVKSRDFQARASDTGVYLMVKMNQVYYGDTDCPSYVFATIGQQKLAFAIEKKNADRMNFYLIGTLTQLPDPSEIYATMTTTCTTVNGMVLGRGGVIPAENVDVRIVTKDSVSSPATYIPVPALPYASAAYNVVNK